MEIALTPDLEDMIARQVDQGNYPSAGEVVRDALRLLREQLETRAKRLEALKREVEEGLQDLACGDFEEYENLGDLAAAIKAQGRARLRQTPGGNG